MIFDFYKIIKWNLGITLVSTDITECIEKCGQMIFDILIKRVKALS